LDLLPNRLNIIVKLTTTTLQNLRLAIAGTIALSGGLIEALDALFMARIPTAWQKKSWEVGLDVEQCAAISNTVYLHMSCQ
jgi:hypothetical protein